MFKPNDFFAAAATANKSVVDAFTTAINASLNSTERLAALNLNTARAVLADTASNTNALLSAKDPQALVALQATLAKPAVEKAMAYSQSVYEILSQSSAGLTSLVEGQTAEIKKSVTVAIEQSLKNAPAGSEAIVAAIKNAMSTADAAYDNATRAAKQATATFEANVASATAAASKLMAKAA